MSLQRFIDLGEIEIARHPKSNMRRLLVLQENQFWSPVGKQIGLGFWVHYLNEDGTRCTEESLRPYRRPLVADMHTKVNAQMQVLPVPGPAPTPVVEDGTVTNAAEIAAHAALVQEYNSAFTEYQYFMGAANDDVNIFELMYNTAILRASQGKFDI